MPTNPSVALHVWLTSLWTTTTEYTVPAAASVKFDIKFGSTKGFFYFIVIENMPTSIRKQILGASRVAVTETKRLQILSIGTTAEDKHWNMEKHIDSLINGNITGLQTTYGINEVGISEFREIPTDENDGVITNMQPNTGFHKVRSYALVTMTYEEESTTA